MTDEALVARMKELVADPRTTPLVHDLVQTEASAVLEAMRQAKFAPDDPYSDDALALRLAAYEELVANLCRLLALGARWGIEDSRNLWPAVIGRVASSIERSSGVNVWLDLIRYPGLVLLYVAGVAAGAGRRDNNLAALLATPVVLEREDWKSASEVLYAQAVLDHRAAQSLPGLDRRHTPLSDHLAEVIRPWLAELIPFDAEFERQFDRFEFLLGLVHFDLTRGETGGWGPVGRFSWRGKYRSGEDVVIAAEIEREAERRPLLELGLFGRNFDRLKLSLEGYRAHVEAVRRSQF
jgi:hypothetical protein